MSLAPSRQQLVSRYVFALVLVVAVAACALLFGLYMTNKADTESRNVIENYHLRTQALIARVSGTLNLVQDFLRTGALNQGERPSRFYEADIPGYLFTINEDMEAIVGIQTRFAGMPFVATLDRTVRRMQQLNDYRIDQDSAEQVADAKAFALSLEQLRKLHANAMEARVRTLEEDSTRLARSLIIAVLITLLATGLIVWKILRNLQRSLEYQNESDERFQHMQKLEALGNLVGGVAHDFNNLLTAILGNVELLIPKSTPDDDFHDGLHEVKKAGERATSLTRQLLAFARKQPIKSEVVDLNVLIRDMESMIRQLIGENIGLMAGYDGELAPVALDRGQFEQVLMNLSVNARDAMPLGGQLVISTANVHIGRNGITLQGVPDGSYCRVSVQDTGSGMDKQTVSRAFEPFFTTKPRGEGTGFGLAMAHGIVTASGGHIFVESELGHGSRFDIYLPHSHQKASSPAADSPSTEIPGGVETILLVEDDAQIRDLITASLSELGYRVFSASEGAVAVEISLSLARTIDLILSDVIMPIMSGPEVVDRILETHPNAKVVFMSGYTADVVLTTGISISDITLIMKPFNLPHLAQRIRTALDGREATQPSNIEIN